MLILGLEHYYNARLGVFVSVVGHVLLLLLLTSSVSHPTMFEQPVIYSVTLEGGKQLGGISQVPRQKEAAPVVPPKAVAPKPESAAPKPAEVKNAEPKPEAVKPKENEPDSDAEVSLAEKEAKLKAEQQAREKEARKVEEEKKKAAAAAKTKAEADARAKKEAEKKKEAAGDSPADIDKQLQQAMQRYLGESVDAGGKGFGAAALGGTGMGGGVVRPPEFFVYRDALMAHVKSTWKWHDVSAPLIAQVELDIETDGRITRAVLVSSSGNREYDESVMRALNGASPVPPPPEIVYHFFKRVRITFDPRD